MTSLSMTLAPGPATDAGRAIVRLNASQMVAAHLRAGDIVRMEGSKRTHARVIPSAGEDKFARTDEVTAANAGALWGDSVQLNKAELPSLNTLRLRSQSDLRTSLVAPALLDMCLSEGDRYVLNLEEDSQFQAPSVAEVFVEALDPSQGGRVTLQTKITFNSPRQSRPNYPGIAGLDAQITAIHETVELPLERPELFRRIGVPPPKGVLFSGPPGSGKTLLARALAERTKASFFDIAGPEIVSKHYGETERALRDIFTRAAREAPSIIFIDEIDAIAPQRDSLSGEKQVERRTVGQLLTLLDGLGARDRVVVIAATNLPDSIDPALRRPGRLEREIAFAAPDVHARQEIIALHLSSAPLSKCVDLQTIAHRSSGYLGADLAALAREAALAALSRARDVAGSTSLIEAEDLFLTQGDLEKALANTRPSLLRAETFDESPPGWKDVGGQASIKAALTEAVIWPLRHRAAFESLGLNPPRGILLTGPPGTGKTLMARALACEAEMNFIPVQSSKILSQFFGEAERAVEALFRRARLVAPALLFFDEIDTMTPPRGQADSAVDRVIAQLLTEIDGMHNNDGITVIAATNRPEKIDPALLRAGRFDVQLKMEPPDMDGRLEVLSIHSRTRALDASVDLEAIARRTDGATPAELASIVADAARKSLTRWRSGDKTATPSITNNDFADALEGFHSQSTRSAGRQQSVSPSSGNTSTKLPP